MQQSRPCSKLITNFKTGWKFLKLTLKVLLARRRHWCHSDVFTIIFNQFHAAGLFLYPQKTSVAWAQPILTPLRWFYCWRWTCFTRFSSVFLLGIGLKNTRSCSVVKPFRTDFQFHFSVFQYSTVFSWLGIWKGTLGTKCVNSSCNHASVMTNKFIHTSSTSSFYFAFNLLFIKRSMELGISFSIFLGKLKWN